MIRINCEITKWFPEDLQNNSGIFHNLTVYSNHFELGNGVMTTLKRRSFLALIFSFLCITINSGPGCSKLG